MSECECVCVCVCMLCEDIEKECRVGRAFVHFTWAATQCPCSPSLEAPARPTLSARKQCSCVCLYICTHVCQREKVQVSFEPVIREVPISIIA